MSSYFSKFKLAQYNGSYCKNILSRAAITQHAMKASAIYHPYIAKAGERPDTVSYYYYDVPENEWLIFFANDIIDPYYQWYLTDEQFNSVMREKYGSIARAQTRIKHFETNWGIDSRQISVSAYNLLPARHKKYWVPFVDQADRPVYYTRKKETLISTTNRILRLSTAGSTDTFQDDEDVYQLVNNTIVASATIDIKDGNSLIVKHVRGNFNINHPIIGADSNVSLQIANVTVLSTPIPLDETIYWTDVSFYDYEAQINESNKVMRIMDARYVEQSVNNLAAIMS